MIQTTSLSVQQQQTHARSDDGGLLPETASFEAVESSGRSSDELDEANGLDTDTSPASSTDPDSTSLATAPAPATVPTSGNDTEVPAPSDPIRSKTGG
ncbi:hypothetical protein Hanom_Chr16g01517651 [Helianthus anomalus]